MVSKNGIALAILIVEAVLSSLGVEFEPGTVAKAVEGCVVTVGLLLAVWNQVSRPDVSGFFFKK